MTLATALSETSTLTPEAQFEQDVLTVVASAIAAHQQNDLDDAERLYRIVLEASPNQVDANFNSGVLMLQRQQPATAIAHFELAVAADPNEPRYWAAYVDALIQSGETDAARLMLDAARQRGLKGPAISTASAQVAALTA